MNRVIAISLNGNSYQIDEPGYAALETYLRNASVRLEGDPDSREIIADLEQAIADKCDRFLGPHKSVVSTEEVRQIIEEMGEVDLPGDQPSEEPEAEPDGERVRPEREEPRRLYRIRDGAMFAGVCQGLGVYFDIDPTIVRAVFVVVTFASAGIAGIVYLALLIFVPEAGTPEEEAAAYGVPFNAQDVLDKAKTRFESLKGEAKQWKARARSRRARRRDSGAHPLHNMLPFVGLFFAIWLGASLFRAFVPSVVRPDNFFGGGFAPAPPWINLGLLVLIFVGVLAMIQLAHAGESRGRPGLLHALLTAIGVVFVLSVIYNSVPGVQRTLNVFFGALYGLFY